MKEAERWGRWNSTTCPGGADHDEDSVLVCFKCQNDALDAEWNAALQSAIGEVLGCFDDGHIDSAQICALVAGIHSLIRKGKP